MRKLFDALLMLLEAAVNRATSIVETVRLLGEISRELKELRAEVRDVKSYLSNQEELARIMIEQGGCVDGDEHFPSFDDGDVEKDKKDMN